MAPLKVIGAILGFVVLVVLVLNIILSSICSRSSYDKTVIIASNLSGEEQIYFADQAKIISDRTVNPVQIAMELKAAINSFKPSSDNSVIVRRKSAVPCQGYYILLEVNGFEVELILHSC